MGLCNRGNASFRQKEGKERATLSSRGTRWGGKGQANTTPQINSTKGKGFKGRIGPKIALKRTWKKELVQGRRGGKKHIKLKYNPMILS